MSSPPVIELSSSSSSSSLSSLSTDESFCNYEDSSAESEEIYDPVRIRRREFFKSLKWCPDVPTKHIRMHFCGKWNAFSKERANWKTWDYVGGFHEDFHNVDGNTIYLMGLDELLCQSMEKRVLLNYNLEKFPEYLLSGIKMDIADDYDCLMWFREGDEDEEGYLPVFYQLEELQPLAQMPGQAPPTHEPVISTPPNLDTNMEQSQPTQEPGQQPPQEPSQQQPVRKKLARPKRAGTKNNDKNWNKQIQGVKAFKKSMFEELSEEELDDLPNFKERDAGVFPQDFPQYFYQDFPSSSSAPPPPPCESFVPPSSSTTPPPPPSSSTTPPPPPPQPGSSHDFPSSIGDDQPESDDEDPFDNIEAEESYHSYASSSEGSIGCEPCEDDFEDRDADFEAETEDLYDIDDMDEQAPYFKDLKEPELNMKWPSIAACREYIRDYAIARKFTWKMPKNDGDRFIAVCVNEEKGCNWKFVARVSQAKRGDRHTCVCKTLVNEHTTSCVGNKEMRNTLVDCNWVATKLEADVREHKTVYKARGIVKEIWKRYAQLITYYIGWHARQKNLERIHGNYEESFRIATECCVQVRKRNPGSIAAIRRGADERLKGMCISFASCLKGFREGCRPVLGLDGCFLKGKYGGMCLSITALDGNNGLFPIAIYLCRNECKETWNDFLEAMEPELTLHPEKLVFMSDQQKGLKEVVEELFPRSTHRFCFRHMFQNFKKDNGGGGLFEMLCWGAARSYKESDANDWMAKIAAEDQEAHDWLVKRNVKTWCRAYFENYSTCEHITNNFSESFNSWILELRDKPVSTFVVEYTKMVMCLLYKRNSKAKAMDTNGVVPRVHKIMKKLEKKICEYTWHGAANGMFSVEKSKDDSWLVDLNTRTCECNQWQLTGMPCVHAVCIIANSRLPLTSLVSEYLTIKNYQKVYSNFVLPLPRMKDWPSPQYECLPWEFLRPAGRPKKNRRRDPNEASSSGAKKRRMKCGTCGQYDHNKATCKGPSRAEVRANAASGHQTTNASGQGTRPSGQQGTTRGGRTTAASERGGRTNAASERGGRTSTVAPRGMGRTTSTTGRGRTTTSGGRTNTTSTTGRGGAATEAVRSRTRDSTTTSRGRWTTPVRGRAKASRGRGTTSMGYNNGGFGIL